MTKKPPKKKKISKVGDMLPRPSSVPGLLVGKKQLSVDAQEAIDSYNRSLLHWEVTMALLLLQEQGFPLLHPRDLEDDPNLRAEFWMHACLFGMRRHERAFKGKPGKKGAVDAASRVWELTADYWYELARLPLGDRHDGVRSIALLLVSDAAYTDRWHKYSASSLRTLIQKALKDKLAQLVDRVPELRENFIEIFAVKAKVSQG